MRIGSDGIRADFHLQDDDPHPSGFHPCNPLIIADCLATVYLTINRDVHSKFDLYNYKIILKLIFYVYLS
jgi:hypothetical protein